MEIRLLVERDYEVCDSSATLASVRGPLLDAGFVVVMDRDRFLGILTPDDVLRSGGETPAKGLRERPRVDETDDLAAVLRQMADAGTCVLPVFRFDRFVGVVRRLRLVDHLLEHCERLEQRVGRQERLLVQVSPGSEERFGQLVECLPQTVFEFDDKGFFTYVNRCALETFGYRADEVVGLHVSEVFVPEEWDRIRANLSRLFAAGSFDDHEYVAKRKDGSTFPVQIFSSLILRNGQPAGVRGIVVDISGRKEWEHALRTSEHRYRRLIETAQDGICVFDSLGRLLEFNESFCRISGYSPQELRRMTIGDLDAVESPEQILCHIGRIGESGTDRFETKHRRKDGVLIDVDVAATLLDPLEGRFVIFVRDTTEQKRIESRIKEREATLLHAARLSTLGEMASGIAHELNQPLSAILSYGDACLCLAEARPPDLARIVRNLGQIVSQGERAGVIIRRMRALAKGRIPRYGSVDLNETVRNAVSLVRWELSQNGMPLSLELAESVPPVFADSVQIEQVLLNLIRNAIDAMRHTTDEPRLLTLRTLVSNDGHVRVEVCDRGIGLSQAQREHLFEPFFTTKPDGLGIGLSISRTIVEAHEGILDARPNVGRGTVFFFSLPVHHAAVR